MATTDTHKLVKDLTRDGLSTKLSETLGQAFLNVSKVESFASKEQFSYLEKEQSDIKVDIAIIKTDISHIKETMSTKADITQLRADTKADLKVAILELKGEIKQSKIDMLKWNIPFFVTIIVLIVTCFFMGK